MTKLQDYLSSIQANILAEAKAELVDSGITEDSEEYAEALANAVEEITDEYGQGFADDADARRNGDYPYDGSLGRDLPDFDRSPEPGSWEYRARYYGEG